jgi:uncharacterized membrane protein
MRTTASVGGHPVHMMVVHFPMAFLMGSAAFDVAAAVGLAVPARQARWRWTARWKLVSDCAVRVVAAAEAGGGHLFDLVGFSLGAAVSPHVLPLPNMRSMQ